MPETGKRKRSTSDTVDEKGRHSRVRPVPQPSSVEPRRSTRRQKSASPFIILKRNDIVYRADTTQIKDVKAKLAKPDNVLYFTLDQETAQRYATHGRKVYQFVVKKEFLVLPNVCHLSVYDHIHKQLSEMKAIMKNKSNLVKAFDDFVYFDATGTCRRRSTLTNDSNVARILAHTVVPVPVSMLNHERIESGKQLNIQYVLCNGYSVQGAGTFHDEIAIVNPSECLELIK